MTESNTVSRPTCCAIGCDVVAEYQITTQRRDGGMAGPDIYSDDTEACETHVGSLLGHQPEMSSPEDAYWRVVPL